MLAAGVALFLLSYLGFSVSTTKVALLAIAVGVAGIAIGRAETAQHSAVAALAPEGIRGSAFGLLATVQAFGNFAASAIAGLVWTAVSPKTAFLYLAPWMLLGLAMLVRTALGQRSSA
jgi:MFS family permease